MAVALLACTSRGCGLPLERRERTLACASGHSYDVARSGYVNLLQPQDRRSPRAGDSPEALRARADLLSAGVGLSILNGFAERAAALDLDDTSVVTDLGSGGGDLLARLARRRPITGIGIDISAPAADQAARRFPGLTWLVANADRRLPLVDGSVALVLSLHGRRNPKESSRVLAPGGFLLVGVPAPDDLIELRAVVQEHGVVRERADALLAEHEALFTLVKRTSIREQPLLTRESLLNLLRGTYRGARRHDAERVETLDSLKVTLASESFLFRRRA
ncbi:MAG: putative RNA methyltransferase [Vicinamibacterales bacterium]